MLKRTIIASTLLLSVSACGGNSTSNMTYEEHQQHLRKIASEYKGTPVRVGDPRYFPQAKQSAPTYKIIEGVWTFDYTGPESAMLIKRALGDTGFEVVDMKTHGLARYMSAKHVQEDIYGPLSVGVTYQVRPGTLDVKLSMRSAPDFSPDMAEKIAGEIRESIVAQIMGDKLPALGTSQDAYVPQYAPSRQTRPRPQYNQSLNEAVQSANRMQYDPQRGEVYDPYGY